MHDIHGQQNNTVKPAHNGQTRSQGKPTTKSRWLLRATET